MRIIDPEKPRFKAFLCESQTHAYMRHLSASECLAFVESREDLLLIDLRSLDEFCASSIRGSVPFLRDLHAYMEEEPLFPKGQGVVFVESKRSDDGGTRSFPAMQGWEILGTHAFDQSEWLEAGGHIDMVIGVEADELAMDIPYDDRLLIVDVREPARFSEEHAVGALNLPLKSLFDPGSMSMLSETENLYIHAEDDRDAVLAAALLKRQGYHNLRVVEGGWEAMRREKGIAKEKDSGKLN
jgi:hydroxyacylglutathione hydrolase